MTDRKFRRYFRMSKQLFKRLCDIIQDNIPPHEFKSEEYLEKLLESPVVDPSRNILFAHAQSTGGFVSGEIKLAITLRILGGATYMDCALLFEVSFNHAHKIVKSVVQDWLLHKSFYPISGIRYCCDDAKMREVALQFSQASRGVMNNCVGALDGWVVKIKKPTKSDGVDNPQSFYSRKGYYGINAQVIVDKKKKILSRSIMSRGAEHDSTAFRNSELYKWLMQNYQTMAQKGFHFIGDSAYALKSFLLTPYDNAVHGSAEDNYNFFHSSSRISVECCFGEIDLRFGIFWQPLKYSLDMNCAVIDACFRLHNFIIDHRACNTDMDSIDREIFNEDSRRFFAVATELSEGVFGGEDDIRRDAEGNMIRGGRPQRSDASSTEMGKLWRDKCRDEIARLGLSRPAANWFRNCNRVMFDH